MNQTMTFDIDGPLPLSKRLKAETRGAHERLDQAITERKPFASRENYALFLRVQRDFHHDIDALYNDPALDELLPDLAGRRRLGQIDRDLMDVDQAPAANKAAVFQAGDRLDLARALGWLYVAEGSNLGAAFLAKEAAIIGLTQEFGARHLAGAPEGRGLHWRTFTTALDTIALDKTGEARVIAGATEAFDRVYGLVGTYFR